jgi:hypothetical protein
MSQLFYLPDYQAVSGSTPLAGAKLSFFKTGTTIPHPVYADPARTAVLPNPVIADTEGRFPPIYPDPAAVYRARLTDSNDAQQWQEDGLWLQLFPRTKAESDAGLALLNFAYAPGDVRRYGATGDPAVDDSHAFYLAGLSGHDVYVPEGAWNASIDVRRNNYALYGAGKSRTRIRMPLTTLAITSLSRVSNVVTVTTATTHNVWVGKSVRIQQCNDETFNCGYIVLEVMSPTQFTCHQLNESHPDGSAYGGNLAHANVISAGELCHGNSATEYAGLVIKEITVDGRMDERVDPESDRTDWGLVLTKFSHFDIDADGENCFRAGVALFNNSSFGLVRSRVRNCGFASVDPAPGFDVDNSKQFTADIVAEDCKYGTRFLDNCSGISARLIAYNATVIGHIYGSQAVHENQGNDLTLIAKGGCSSAGVTTGTKCRSTRLTCVVQGVTGVGVYEVAAVTEPHSMRSNTYNIVTRECAAGAVRVEGDGGTWYVHSDVDGRGAATGDYFAVDNYGSQNTFYVNVMDHTSEPKIRGVVMREGANNNRVISFQHNTLVSGFADSGNGNDWPCESDAGNAAMAGDPTTRVGLCFSS